MILGLIFIVISLTSFFLIGDFIRIEHFSNLGDYFNNYVPELLQNPLVLPVGIVLLIPFFFSIYYVRHNKELSLNRKILLVIYFLIWLYLAFSQHTYFNEFFLIPWIIFNIILFIIVVIRLRKSKS
jgi:hypothetical protein